MGRLEAWATCVKEDQSGPDSELSGSVFDFGAVGRGIGMDASWNHWARSVN